MRILENEITVKFEVNMRTNNLLLVVFLPEFHDRFLSFAYPWLRFLNENFMVDGNKYSRTTTFSFVQIDPLLVSRFDSFIVESHLL